MTSTPQEPLDEPVDTTAQDAGPAAVDQAAVSGSPAEADSDLGYSRGGEGESVEQAGEATGEAGGTDYLDSDTFTGGGDPRNG
jgi:hypothetical protein